MAAGFALCQVPDLSGGKAGSSIATGRSVPRRPVASADRLANAPRVTLSPVGLPVLPVRANGAFYAMLTRHDGGRGCALARAYGLRQFESMIIDVQGTELNIAGPLQLLHSPEYLLIGSRTLFAYSAS